MSTDSVESPTPTAKRALRTFVLCLATAGLLMLPIASIGQIGVANWFYFIHCQGIGTNHTSTENEWDPESFNDAGYGYNQCHGTRGQDGTCNVGDLDLGVFFRVECDEVGFKDTRTVCRAQATCTNGDTLYCISNDGQSFSGVETDSNGTDRLFVACEDSNGYSTGADWCAIN